MPLHLTGTLMSLNDRNTPCPGRRIAVAVAVQACRPDGRGPGRTRHDIVVYNRGSVLSRPSHARRLASNSQPGGQRMAAVSVGDKHVQSSVSRATVDHLCTLQR